MGREKEDRNNHGRTKWRTSSDGRSLGMDRRRDDDDDDDDDDD